MFSYIFIYIFTYIKDFTLTSIVPRISFGVVLSQENRSHREFSSHESITLVKNIGYDRIEEDSTKRCK